MATTMFEEFRQAQAENARLLLERNLARDQAASAAGDIELVQTENARLRYALESVAKPSGAYSQDPAEYRKNVIDWCIETAKAALAEEDEDGQLKPEVEARLRESLKTPREDLLTSGEIRQKLAEEGDADADPG